MTNYFEKVDSCITDACAFLEIERSEFFTLARRWDSYVHQFTSFDEPIDFYKSWQGDVGKSNLCANIVDQFSRFEVASVLDHLCSNIRKDTPLAFADVSCGTAALSFDCSKLYGRAHLTDLPNLSQDFIAFRCKRHGLTHVAGGGLESITSPVQVMVSVDVLEHVRESSAFFRLMDERLSAGGLMLLRIPWYSVAPHPEHLPEAEANWKIREGGEETIRTRYKLIHPIQYGGVYQKVT